MANKKATKASPPPDKTELEQRVDALMDPKQAATPPTASKATPAEPAIDIFKDQPAPLLDTPSKPDTKAAKTAPAVPAELLEGIPADADGSSQSVKVKVSTKKAAKPEPTTAPEPSPEPKPEFADEPAPEPTAPETGIDLENANTDAAVDDIVVSESDTVLAVEDAMARRRNADVDVPRRHSMYGRLVLMLVVVMSAIVAYLWYR